MIRRYSYPVGVIARARSFGMIRLLSTIRGEPNSAACFQKVGMVMPAFILGYQLARSFITSCIYFFGDETIKLYG